MTAEYDKYNNKIFCLKFINISIQFDIYTLIRFQIMRKLERKPCKYYEGICDNNGYDRTCYIGSDVSPGFNLFFH